MTDIPFTQEECLEEIQGLHSRIKALEQINAELQGVINKTNEKLVMAALEEVMKEGSDRSELLMMIRDLERERDQYRDAAHHWQEQFGLLSSGQQS